MMVKGAKHLWSSATLAARRKRVHQHFDDLEKCYFAIRQGEIPGNAFLELCTYATISDLKILASIETFQISFCFLPGNSDTDALEYFTESLSKFTRFSGFRPLATLSYASEVHNGSSIVSR